MRAPRPSSAWRAFYLGLALCLVVAGLALLLWSAPTPHEGVRLAQSQQSGPQPAPQPAPPPLTSAPIRPASAPVPQPEPELADPNDLAAHMPPGLRPEQAPTMGEVIAGLHRAGVRTGLGAFNPPGTRPPLIGLAVPEDFELPAGYVRHHQATDDGQRIEAILDVCPRPCVL